MTELRIDEPDQLFTKTVNDQGGLYLGKEYAGVTLQVAIKRVDGGNDER